MSSPQSHYTIDLTRQTLLTSPTKSVIVALSFEPLTDLGGEERAGASPPSRGEGLKADDVKLNPTTQYISPNKQSSSVQPDQILFNFTHMISAFFYSNIFYLYKI